MRIRLLHTLSINRRLCPPGSEAVVSDSLAEQLIAAGHAKQVGQAAAPKPRKEKASARSA